MMRRTRSFLWLPAFCLVLAAALYSALWGYEAHRVRQLIARYIAERMTEGTEISLAGLKIGGFPLALEVEVTGLHFAGLPFSPHVVGDVPVIRARGRIWQLAAWHLQAPQGMALRAPLADGRFAALTVARFAGKSRRAAPPITGLAIELVAEGASLQLGETAGAAEETALSLVIPDPEPQDRSGEAFGFELSVENAVLPIALPPLGSAIRHLSFAGGVLGKIPNRSLAEALTIWRDQGGSVDLNHLRLDWNGLQITGSGLMTLDPAMQPALQFTTEVTGWESILDTMVALGSLQPGDANFERQGLDLLSDRDAEGRRRLKVPMTLRNGQWLLGPAKIGRFPLVVWR